MKINGWYRIGIVASLMWLAAGSWYYFHVIDSHPSLNIDCVLVGCFTWIEDEAADNSKVPEGFKIIIPKFNSLGLAAYLAFPLGIAWVLILTITYTVRWVWAGFKA